ncbi:HNH endonuclease signature motif containing protein, partial [[Ruminococcus] torques]
RKQIKESKKSKQRNTKGSRRKSAAFLYIKKKDEGMVYRPDRDGSHRGAFERNKKKIYATQTVCGICGKPVDFGLKYPHPLSPCIDHIIPIAKGGHPSDINNLQLAHWTCNRQKSDKLIKRRDKEKDEVISNRVLPHTFDWKNIRRSK